MPSWLCASAWLLNPVNTAPCALPWNHAGALPVAPAPPPPTWLCAASSWPRPLYTLPITTGRSMSPSRNPTSTSWPLRGSTTPPQLSPAHGVITRTQVHADALPGALSSPPGCASALLASAPRWNGNCTLIRWSRSDCTGSPSLTTIALNVPATVGLGCRRRPWPSSVCGR